MSQILDPIPEGDKNQKVMSYLNATSSIQVARITNIANWYFERVVFPGQRLVFEAPLSANLEIHTGMMASSILSDTIPCERLVLEDEAEPQSRKVKENQQVIEYRNEGIDPDSKVTHIPRKLIKDLQMSEPSQRSVESLSSYSLKDKVS